MKDYRNIHEMVTATIVRCGDKTAFRWYTSQGGTDSVTWDQFAMHVRQVAKSLISLGVAKDNKVGIFSYTCYPWIAADVGITTAGAVTVGIYQSLLPKDCQYILNHSEAVVLFVENEELLKRVLEIRSKIPAIRKVVLFKGKTSGDEWIISFEEFLQLGKDIPDAQVQQRIDQTTSSDPAAIVYTSGTTGVPKGAVITHDNLTFTAESVRNSVETLPDDHMFLFLPLAHVFARIGTYAALLLGITVTLATSMDTIVEEIKKTKPDWFPSVPRIFEKVYSKVVSGAEAKGGVALMIFRWACKVGYQVSDLKVAKKPIPTLLGLQYSLATKLVFHKLQDALGGRLRWCVSGAAPLNANIARFFHAAGILVLEGIGMTENTSFTNVNRLDNYRFGWVGLPGPGVEQRVAPDGEIMFRGRNVMKEYYKMPEETAKTITPDGWLLTGDLGEIDQEGFLKIVGRKKELIITAGGKNIAPSPIEGAIATSKYINQVCLIGDRRKYITALVTLDADNIKAFAAEKAIPYQAFDELFKQPQVVELIGGEIELHNRDLPSFEQVKRFTILPEFTIDNGMITPTLKVKKNVVMKVFEKEIEAMYPPD